MIFDNQIKEEQKMKKDAMSETGNGIEITKENGRTSFAQGGITIRHEAKPIGSEAIGCAYLVIDCSTSMSGDKLNQAINGAKQFIVDAKTKEYIVGLIQFDSSATHLCEPRKELSVLYRYLESMSASGSTNMTDAILLATEKLVNRKEARVMVIITDGAPDNRDTAISAAQEAKNLGIEIIAIGTDDADQAFLKKIASMKFLGIKVPSAQFGQAIASAAKLLLGRRGG